MNYRFQKQATDNTVFGQAKLLALVGFIVLSITLLFVDYAHTQARKLPPASDDVLSKDGRLLAADTSVYLPTVMRDWTNCQLPDVFCVGLVSDVGRVNDNAFNQSAWEGVQAAAQKLGAHADFIETNDARDYVANIEVFAQNNYDVIVTVGFAPGEATSQMAQAYPDIKFIGVDQYQTSSIDNLAGLVFHRKHQGFLAGALAAYLSQTGTVGGVFATNLVPAVVDIKEGYDAGVLYVAPHIQVISTYHPGGLDVAFVDPAWGSDTARQTLDMGADAIFAAGGKTGNGALIETAEANMAGESVFCIGVDTDQWLTVPEARSCLVSSSMILITPGVAALIERAYQNDFPAGNFYGDIGLAPFHDFESYVPQPVQDSLQTIADGLNNGSINP